MHHTLAAGVDGEDLVLHLHLDIVKVVLRVVVFKTNILQNILLLKTFGDILGSLTNLSIYSCYLFELIDEEDIEHKNDLLLPMNVLTLSILEASMNYFYQTTVIEPSSSLGIV